MIELATLDDPRPSKALIMKFQAEVNSEVPPESFWWPKQEDKGQQTPTSGE
jgi:hypothetical protein